MTTTPLRAVLRTAMFRWQRMSLRRDNLETAHRATIDAGMRRPRARSEHGVKRGRIVLLKRCVVFVIRHCEDPPGVQTGVTALLNAHATAHAKAWWAGNSNRNTL